jgi:hypothetical protein
MLADTDFEQVQAVKVLSKVFTVLSKKQTKTIIPLEYWLSDYQVSQWHVQAAYCA